jgi:hypothetical protein
VTAIEANIIGTATRSTHSGLMPGGFVELSGLRTMRSMLSMRGASLSQDLLIDGQIGPVSEIEAADGKPLLRAQARFPIDQRAFSFAAFRLLRAQRFLLKGGEWLGIGRRAFDILAMLAERACEVVYKVDLIVCAWTIGATTIGVDAGPRTMDSHLSTIGGLPAHRYGDHICRRGRRDVLWLMKSTS